MAGESGAGGAAYQDRGCPEEVAEGIVEEVDEGGGIKVCVAHQLVGKERLARATAEEAAHLPIAHVHLMRDFLWAQWGEGQGTQQPPPGCPPAGGSGAGGGWRSALGVTWIRRLMELMSGRSLLPLSKCLEWERPSWGLTRRGPHRRLHPPSPLPAPSPLTGTTPPGRGPGSAAPQTALQGQRGRISVGQRPPLPGTTDTVGGGTSHQGQFCHRAR